MSTRFRIGLAATSVAALVMLSLLSLSSGSTSISLASLVRGDGSLRLIIFEIRLPRIVLAALVGASLGLSGAILQGYFGNPLAEPYVLGISSGAAFGAFLGSFLELPLVLGLQATAILAFVSALGVTVAAFFFAERSKWNGPNTLLLSGLALGMIFSSITSSFILFSHKGYEKLLFFLMGSVATGSWSKVLAVAPYFCIFASLAFAEAHKMNILGLGDDKAASLGVDVKRTRRLFLACATFLAASSVAVGGVIGFVGLIIPHAIRLVSGPDNRWLFPLSCTWAAAFLVGVDLVARRAIQDTELPIGIVTALVGAPVFIFLLRRTRSE